MIDLQLSNKVSPKAYIFDTSGWIPTVKPSDRPVSNGNGHMANGKGGEKKGDNWP